MIRNAGMLMIVAVVLVSGAASAAPLALSLGETKFLGFSARSSKVELSDASVLSVKTSGSGVELRARQAGVTHVTLRLPHGEKYEFTVHVVPSGAQVYSTNRAEPEHAEFSLTPAPAPAPAKRRAQTARKNVKAASPRA